MSMTRSMDDGITVGRTSNEQERANLRIETISEIMCKSRLRWLGHMERMETESWVKSSTCMNVEG